ncbi:DUF4041 domain-containing protein [Hymenobacter sp. BT186]|uniref:DUF4041 domain-containing protein n=1 Tax=Hymenobacter telluris TaxID=2816474 RepID=A0A939F243_9BACT|nr:DUF4041 domain-containing protein [Hymenobacter telluris]MBO0360695.1 DUF4041 domain-containing protein [Hymenobacter telluris]MBW3376722.1 DUF4041 domain-containing protein [Hymenobacter norwichensis]
MSSLLFLLVCALAAALYFLYARLLERDATIQKLQRQNAVMGSRYKSLAEIETAHQHLTRQNQALQQQQVQLTNTVRQLGNTIVEVKADLEAHHKAMRVAATGYAKDRFVLEVPAFEQRFKTIKGRQAQMIVEGNAARAEERLRVAGNEAEGKRRQEQVMNLMLSAFNGECEAVIAQVQPYKLEIAEKRIRKAFAAVNNLGAAQKCLITDSYLAVRLEELFLTEAYRRRLKTDKEAQREAQTRFREALREAKKLDEARAKAQRDEDFYAEALRRAREQAQHSFGTERQRYTQQIEQLRQSLAQAQEMKRRATAQAQLTTAGHVYVISNIGSFGDNVYKIGMTRRLDPQDRIDELSNASVPFPFDVHAIISCDNAPMLEKRLHHLFQHRRVNMANERKEFFQVSLHEIAAAVQANHGEIRFVHEAAADEYRQTQHLRAKRPQ